MCKREGPTGKEEREFSFFPKDANGILKGGRYNTKQGAVYALLCMCEAVVLEDWTIETILILARGSGCQYLWPA